ncbi:MAG: sensor histidine kinase [Roseibacillus sp.]
MFGKETSIEVFVDREEEGYLGPVLRVPPGTDTLQFSVKPSSLLVRYKLEGLDKEWKSRLDTGFVRVMFFNSQGDPIKVESFPAIGRSTGWKGTVENSEFTPRVEQVTIPKDTDSVAVVMTTGGPAALVGVFAIKDLSISSLGASGESPTVLFSDRESPRGRKMNWNKSGTHPSMAYRVSTDKQDSSTVIAIADNDLTAHADWSSRVRALSGVSAGETLEIRWNEVYSIGLGGNLTVDYERLPPGKYKFIVEELSLTGEPLNSSAAVSLTVPRVFWKGAWFWAVVSLLLVLLSIVLGRFLIRRRIRLHLQQKQLISEERRRIALDLHDDLGTRISHISLLASHANNTIKNPEVSHTFDKISTMSRDLIGALSETVWMLNSRNDDLESLVDFLYRLVNELCRLKKIRCRVDAVYLTENQPISYEFRHNVSLAVKESLNNVLKHSEATELKMKVTLEQNIFAVTIEDNGIGLQEDPKSTGVGLANLERRMKSIGGSCRLEHLEEGGLKIFFRAPVA